MYELFRDIRQLHVDLIQELDLHSKLNKKKSFVVTDSIHILVRLKKYKCLPSPETKCSI